MKKTIEDFRNYDFRLRTRILAIYEFLLTHVEKGTYEKLSWSIDGVNWVYSRLYGFNDNTRFSEIFMENLDTIKEFYNEQNQ
jgi:hypothetical protein